MTIPDYELPRLFGNVILVKTAISLADSLVPMMIQIDNPAGLCYRQSLQDTRHRICAMVKSVAYMDEIGRIRGIGCGKLLNHAESDARTIYEYGCKT